MFCSFFCWEVFFFFFLQGFFIFLIWAYRICELKINSPTLRVWRLSVFVLWLRRKLPQTWPLKTTHTSPLSFVDWKSRIVWPGCHPQGTPKLNRSVPWVEFPSGRLVGWGWESLCKLILVTDRIQSLVGCRTRVPVSLLTDSGVALHSFPHGPLHLQSQWWCSNSCSCFEFLASSIPDLYSQI